MRFNYPEKFKPLLKELKIGFSPYDDLTDDQEMALIAAVEDCFSLYGINEAGDGESDLGAICADFLTWIAEEET